GSFDTAKNALRAHSGAKHSIRRGRRPQLCAVRPTQGAIAATTNCGARMQIAMTTVAYWGARVVSDPAMIGSMAVFESWNSTIAAAKINNGPLRPSPAN